VSLDQSTLGILVIVIGVVALASLILTIILAARMGRMRQQYAVLSGDNDEESFVEAVARKQEEVKALRGDVARFVSEMRATQADLTQALRHVSVVRYDAFGDMGGRMSYSLAMVDDHGNGVVLSTVHARSESRSYIKELRGGMAEVSLSPEEEQVVSEAIADIPAGTRPTGLRPRRERRLAREDRSA